MKNKKSETFKIAACLAIVGGYLDSYTYICRDEVFANAQTGNIIFFVLNLTYGDFLSALLYLSPILAFSFGVLICEYLKIKKHLSYKLCWEQKALIIEMLVLIASAFIKSGRYNIFVIIAISFVCGIQVQSFRKLYGNAFATTMCTGNLRSATESFFYAFVNKDKSLQKQALLYCFVILFFILGVILGSIMTKIYAELSILITAFILIFPLILLNE